MFLYFQYPISLINWSPEIFMEWVQLVIFFIGVFGLFIWNRAERREDSRRMNRQLEGQRALLQAIWQESNKERRF